MIGDAVLFDERDEVRGIVAGQRGFCEVGIRGYEIFGAAMNVGEIAAATSGDQDFFADLGGAFEDGDSSAALSGFDGAEEAGGSCAEDDDVKGFSQEGILTMEMGGTLEEVKKPRPQKTRVGHAKSSEKVLCAQFLVWWLREVRLEEEEIRKVATDHQRASIVEKIWGRAAVPEHFVYRFRERKNRSDWTEWLREIHATADADRGGEAGLRRRCGAERDAVEHAGTGFGIFGRSNCAVCD